MENSNFEALEKSEKNKGIPTDGDGNIAFNIDKGNKNLDNAIDKLGGNGEDKNLAKKGVEKGIQTLLLQVENGEYSNPQIGDMLSQLSKIALLSSNPNNKNILGDVGGSNEQLKKSTGEILSTPTEQLSDVQLA